MRILISNDDGISAPGLGALLKHLQNAGHEVIVVAPDKENSAQSHAITVHDPIFVEKYTFAESPDVKAWMISGRPADCVKMALEVLLTDDLPDLVISGINSGSNMGLDTVYSGTVSAALEASMHNIPAIAVSLDSRSRKADFSTAAEIAVKMVAEYDRFNLPKGTMLNVNVPEVSKEEIKGIKVTKLGNISYDNVFVKRKDIRGRTYYWLGGEAIIYDSDDLGVDTGAVKNNWVAVTPLRHDLTDQNSLEKIKDIII